MAKKAEAETPSRAETAGSLCQGAWDEVGGSAPSCRCACAGYLCLSPSVTERVWRRSSIIWVFGGYL